MTDTPSPARSLVGISLGMLAVVGWGIYNVGTEIGQAQGFRAPDLTLLRYGVGALVLLPWFVWRGRGLDQRRLVVLALVGGPVFALILNQGYQLAPLAHAVVIGPAMSIITTLSLVRVVDGQKISARRMLGMAILLGGLAVIGLDRGGGTQITTSVLKGDLCFVGSGGLWGLYSWLLGRWRMPPVETTAGVAIYASAVYVPVYLTLWGLPDLPGAVWAQQVLFQGLIGGSGALVAFAMAVGILGTARAAVFNALVPPSAVLMAIPMAAMFPSPLQWLGVGLATVGLMLALAFTGPKPATPVQG